MYIKQFIVQIFIQKIKLDLKSVSRANTAYIINKLAYKNRKKRLIN